MGYSKRYSKQYRADSSWGSVVSDSASIANSFGPKGAAITGVMGFGFFYFILPWFFMGLMNDSKSKMTGPLAEIFGRTLDEIFFRRFIHPSEWAGIAILIACTAIACWKASTYVTLDQQDERQLSFIARLLARILSR